MSFEFKECPIKGLYEIQPKVFGDARGYFFECYSERDFFAAGLTEPQGKLVRAIQGRVLDVAVDLRDQSPTFGKWHGVILDSEKQNQFYIPRGFAHGFFVLSDAAVFGYKCTDFYHPEDEGGLMWNDPAIGVDWFGAAAGVEPLLSEKDKKHPAFDTAKKYFSADASSWLGE